jgi:orotidine-5'-phosphate decarboxylase
VDPKDRLIFALDVPDKAGARDYIERLRQEVGLFKVGLELFLAEGPQLVAELANIVGAGRIFLDLKLYDIPATILGATKAPVQGVAWITVPSDIGLSGLQKIAAHRAYKVLAVTVLTSVSGEDLRALGYEERYAHDPKQLVLLRAKMAKEAGCRGVVCSGLEVAAVKAACGPDFLAVCPGIRPEWAAVPGDDQQRVVTPYQAIKAGADYIVVGRPIRTAGDPVAAARRVAAEIGAALKALGGGPGT